MAIISIEEVNPGMVLSEDIRDINTRLLLSRGQQITAKHIRILKVWGVTEVKVVGKVNEKAEKSHVNPEIARMVRKSTEEIFRNVDIEHPAIKNIFELSVAYRSKSYTSSLKGDIQPQINEDLDHKISFDIQLILNL